MEKALNQCFPAQAASLHLAIGIDIGAILISRLEVREHRDPICLRRVVKRAAMLEEDCQGKRIAITPHVR